MRSTNPSGWSSWRERGIDARVADVQRLPFGDTEFDAIVAACMLYHVADPDAGLAECARVLRPGGTFVAVTNSAHDFAELWELVGRDLSNRPLTFCSEAGEAPLQRHFATAVRRDITAEVRFEDADAIRRYVGSSSLGGRFATSVPELTEPLVARKLISVFVATKA